MQPKLPLTDREQKIVNSYRTILREASTRHSHAAALEIAQTRTKAAYWVSTYALNELLDRSEAYESHTEIHTHAHARAKPGRKARLSSPRGGAPRPEE